MDVSLECTPHTREPGMTNGRARLRLLSAAKYYCIYDRSSHSILTPAKLVGMCLAFLEASLEGLSLLFSFEEDLRSREGSACAYAALNGGIADIHFSSECRSVYVGHI